jgi:hypothetical protein
VQSISFFGVLKTQGCLNLAGGARKSSKNGEFLMHIIPFFSYLGHFIKK